MSKLALLTPSLIAAVLAGCAVGPDYQRPVTPLALSFQAHPAIPTAPTEPESRWWQHFGDPVLDDLVDAAISSNHDLRIAEARLSAARALRRGTLWAFGPEGRSIARLNRGRPSDLETGDTTTPVGEYWMAGFDAAWELDIFGGKRRQAEAAAAETDVSQAQWRTTQVSLLAEVAANYFNLRHSESSLDLVRRQADSVDRSLTIARDRVAAGRGTALDTARLESLQHEIQALAPTYDYEISAARHRLAVLLGRQPGDLSLPPLTTKATVTSPVILAVGSPESLLRRRPDVQRAERSLAAATAWVGADTAALFPRVNISGVFQFVGASFGNLGDVGTSGWNVSPVVTWDLLNFGQLHARRDVARARAEAAAAAYEQSVLIALEDVANSLARYRSALDRRQSLDARLAADERAFALAQTQDEAGAIDPLARLDIERNALVSAREAVTARQAQQQALIAVYKALAGSWENPATLTQDFYSNG